MATASPFDAAVRDVLDRLHSATTELEGARDANEVAQKAADLALRLSRSTQAVVGLGGDRRYTRLFSRTADRGRPLSDTAALEMLVAAGFGAGAAVGKRITLSEIRAA